MRNTNTITVSITKNETLGAFVLAYNGYEELHSCIRRKASESNKEFELSLLVQALKALKQFTDKMHLTQVVVYFESNLQFCLIWLMPSERFVIEPNLLHTFENLNYIKENIPMSYNFSFVDIATAKKYLDEKYLVTMNLSSISDLISE